jgi:hypothetical protein
MSRMLELIRASALPSHQVMSASKGALHVPPGEMVEILVYLAEHNKIFGEQAKLTLAAWDEASAKLIAADPNTPKEVLDYWLTPRNFRPVLFPILIENPAVTMTKMAELASTLKGEWIDLMLVSPRVRASRQVLSNMSLNTELSGVQNARVQEALTGKATVLETPELVPQFQKATPDIAIPSTLHIDEDTSPSVASGVETSQEQPVLKPETVEAAASESQGPEINIAEAHDAETHAALVAFLAEHAAELAAEPHKPFQAIGGIYDELAEETVPKATAMAASASPAVTPPPTPPPGGTLRPATHKKLVNPQDEQRGSVLQKIAKLDVKGRIQLAMKGTKEERSILVRDGTKIVALAVLDSPKITDGEVEKFASQKNVLEAVLRAIPMKRRFAKNYAVVRNLVFNPRTPLDVALGLMKNLLVQDLRHLSGNKEVPDTVRKLALRMFKQKSENANKK